MNILNVAYPFAPVSKNSAGGAEQILYMIDAALVGNGHVSYVTAEKKSEISGNLFSDFDISGKITEISKTEIHKKYARLISKVIDKFRIDLVHMHGIDFYRYIPETKIPILVTLHLPVDWYPLEVFQNNKNISYNCVSKNQISTADRIPNLTGYIENGININDFSPCYIKKNYAVILGRICPEKGFHYAIEAAKKTCIPLVIAGELFNYDYHIRYFEEKIKPGLDENCIYIGPIGLEEKKAILSHAKCMLITTEAWETSSLVAMESLACGTPVISFNRGALPEIIENGKTGFIVNNIDEMIQSIKQISKIDPEVCRLSAEKKFDSKIMTLKYINLYGKLIEKSDPVYYRKKIILTRQ
jgi:glycosyltransferase involved in cell wall biosynthesis